MEKNCEKTHIVTVLEKGVQKKLELTAKHEFFKKCSQLKEKFASQIENKTPIDLSYNKCEILKQQLILIYKDLQNKPSYIN